jgi:hypothetical protein
MSLIGIGIIGVMLMMVTGYIALNNEPHLPLHPAPALVINLGTRKVGSWVKTHHPTTLYEATDRNWSQCDADCIENALQAGFSRFHIAPNYFPNGRPCSLYGSFIEPENQRKDIPKWEGNISHVIR